MKKIVFILVLLFLPMAGFAATECPIGLKNDPSPGLCASYTDSNNNNLCDLSEVHLSSIADGEIGNYTDNELKEMTVAQVAKIYEINADEYADALAKQVGASVGTRDALQKLHDEYELCSGTAGALALDLKERGVNSSNIENETDVVKNTATTVSTKYKFKEILIVTLFFYLITWSLVGYKKITLLTHRRIWNLVLLATFLISGILGVMLILRINYSWFVAMPFDMLYWHVEIGTVMAIISFFHIVWHWRYFTCILLNTKNKNCDK